MRTLAIIALLILSSSALTAADKSTAGEFITEPATLLSLGFEWRIDGDDKTRTTRARTTTASGQTKVRSSRSSGARRPAPFNPSSPANLAS